MSHAEEFQTIYVDNSTLKEVEHYSSLVECVLCTVTSFQKVPNEKGDIRVT